MLVFARALLLFLLILLVLRFVRRVYFALARAPKMDPNQLSHTDTVKDPVCGMYMDPRLALRMEHKKQVLFFCSAACREKFVLAGHRSEAADRRKSETHVSE